MIIIQLIWFLDINFFCLYFMRPNTSNNMICITLSLSNKFMIPWYNLENMSISNQNIIISSIGSMVIVWKWIFDYLRKNLWWFAVFEVLVGVEGRRLILSSLYLCLPLCLFMSYSTSRVGSWLSHQSHAVLDVHLLWSLLGHIQAMDQGVVSIRKTVLPGVGIPMLKIRRPNGRLIFNMEIAIRR